MIDISKIKLPKNIDIKQIKELPKKIPIKVNLKTDLVKINKDKGTIYINDKKIKEKLSNLLSKIPFKK